MQSAYIEHPPQRYRLNMQVLADELEARRVKLRFYCRGEEATLNGVRFYNKGEKLSRDYVYLLFQEERRRDFRSWENVHFVVIGEVSLEEFSFTSSVIGIHSGEEPHVIYNMLQEIFEKYAMWDEQLQWALQRENPLEQMLKVSRDIFENPIFVHDTDFYVLACPRWVEGMLHWEKEARTGREMVPLDLINEFKVDEEYLSGLKARKVTMFSSAIRGYRILFANLWSQDRYDGRICVDELERPLRKSDYLHLGHLAEMVMMCLERQKLFWLSLGSDIDRFFTQVLDGEGFDPHVVQDYLRYLRWDREDKYLILKIAPDREDYSAMTPAGLFGYIEAQVAEGRALLFHQDIAVIVNLTAGNTTVAEVLSNLAYILREGLFKMGVSAELSNFLDIRDGYSQASIALEYGKKSSSMLWYYHFEDYALRFLLDCARKDIHPHLLGSEKLRKLKEYDEKNNTELYHTMEVYLQLERNVVQTSKALFIHRSTLFYRLDRIQKIVEIDFENEEERLCLALSYQLDRMDD